MSFQYRTDVFEKMEHVTYPDEGDKFEREPEIGLFTLKGCGKFQKLEINYIIAHSHLAGRALTYD